MDGVDRGRRWKNLKERMRLKGVMGCCGATWSSRSSSMSVREENDDDYYEGDQRNDQEETMGVRQIPVENSPDPACVGQTPAGSGMNLATALAAERHFREAHNWEGGGGDAGVSPATATPVRVPLMRLLEEADGVDGEMEKEIEERSDRMCCVCMGRRKGAAFIPCGHTFCRPCSRDLWLNRGSCPLCNRPIHEILDIF